MKANELRIGNWVRWNYEERSEGNVYPVEYGYELDDIKNNPNIVKPIPLTEEWLIKFGYFTQNGAWGTIAVKEYHKKNTHQLDLFGNAWVHDREGYRVDLDYVHQLQNLFYYLCGEELKIIDNERNLENG